MKASLLDHAFFSVLLVGACSLAVFLLQMSQPTLTPKSNYDIVSTHIPFTLGKNSSPVTHPFRVDWPPREPAEIQSQLPPLLQGKLIVATGMIRGQRCISVRIQLSRLAAEQDRVRWNRQLAFPEHSWMSKVRVWDVEKKWLWPNLPFLLRAFGVEREQRYGGVDPGKGIDNDFAAVVVKPLKDIHDKEPEITAEWYPLKPSTVNKQTIVHDAVSADLIWPAQRKQDQSGELGVWLIYADFLGSPPPRSWPKEQESSGGILSFFSIRWTDEHEKGLTIIEVKPAVPPKATGVDWDKWLRSTRKQNVSDQ